MLCESYRCRSMDFLSCHCRISQERQTCPTYTSSMSLSKSPMNSSLVSAPSLRAFPNHNDGFCEFCDETGCSGYCSCSKPIEMKYNAMLKVSRN